MNVVFPAAVRADMVVSRFNDQSINRKIPDSEEILW